MPRICRAAKVATYFLAGLSGNVVVLAALLLGYSRYRYAQSMSIDTQVGINEAKYVRIGGIDPRSESRQSRVPLGPWWAGIFDDSADCLLHGLGRRTSRS